MGRRAMRILRRVVRMVRVGRVVRVMMVILTAEMVVVVAPPLARAVVRRC